MRAFALLLTLTTPLAAQTTLHQQIVEIAKDTKGTLITLPDGRRLAVAIFVTDAYADQATCEAVIARIARAIYGSAVPTAR